MERGLMYMKMVKSDRSDYEPHFWMDIFPVWRYSRSSNSTGVHWGILWIFKCLLFQKGKYSCISHGNYQYSHFCIYPVGVRSVGRYAYQCLLLYHEYRRLVCMDEKSWRDSFCTHYFYDIQRKKVQLVVVSRYLVFVSLVYWYFDKFNNWTAYVDTFTTGIFFVGMWLMAKKKLENWVYWIIGDVISVPLYWYKGLIFTSLQYFLFTIIAIYGYLAWKKSLNKSPQTLLR